MAAALTAWCAPAQAGLIVKYKDNAPTSLRSRIATSLGSSYRELPSAPQMAILEPDPTRPLQQTLAQLRDNSQVEYVEIDEGIRAHATPNDPRFAEQWALNSAGPNIHAEEAWDFLTNTRPVIIALVDSGCDNNHEDTQANVWQNEGEIADNGQDDDGDGYVDDKVGYDFQNDDASPYDDFEHGTMVFGIMGAAGNNGLGISGIGWSANIMCLKVLDSAGNSTISKAVEAVYFAINHRARIINMSWGYVPSSSPSRALSDAINAAKNSGILVIASAGNGVSGVGQNNDSNSNQANYPSSYSQDNIIAVAATDTQDELASFSNYGASTVDLGAPGVSILSTHPHNDYRFFTGTSASAPHVSGAAALIWALNPDLNYSQVKRLLLETTDPLPSLSDKSLTGGRLNIANAIKASPIAGGHLLESPSNLPNTAQNTDAHGGDEEVSAHSGCSLSPNARQSQGACLFLLLWGAVLARRLRKALEFDDR